MKNEDKDKVITALAVFSFILFLRLLLVLAVYTRADAAELKTVRSPIHAQHIGSWLRLSNEIIITPTFDVVEPEEECLGDTDKTLESDQDDYVTDQNDDVAENDVGNIEPDPQDLEYLAIVIFCEAGADAQSDETRYMIGDVVLNRVADSRYPDTIYKVLTQKAQYGRFYWTGVVWPERASYKGNAHAVERAREIAYNLLTDTRHSDLWGKGYIYQDCRIQGKDNIWSDGICFGR